MKCLFITTVLVGLFSLNAGADTAAVAPTRAFYSVVSPIFNYQRLSNGNQSRVRQLVDQAVESFNSRFDSRNVLLSGDPRGGAFMQTQDAVLTELKNSGAAVAQFTITNNVMSALNTQAYLIFDEQQKPVAFAFEYRSYDRDTRTHLRIRPLQSLTYVNTIQEIERTPSIALRGTVNSTTGGDVQIICLMDKKKNEYKTFTVRLAKDASGRWGVIYQGNRVSTVKLNLWVDILRGNGGVRQVTVNSQQNVTLNAF